MSRGRSKASFGTVVIAVVCALAIWLADGGLQTLHDFDRGADAQTQQAQTRTDASDETWDESAAPQYYVVTGDAPDSLASEVTADEDVTTETRQGSLAVPATSEIRATYQDVQHASDTDRPDLPDPAMWPKNFRAAITCPDGSVYHGWFWNRSHMVARSLGGADEARNLVAGTRMQNVGGNDGEGGMAYTETQARDYLRSHKDGWVAYRVTANYLGLETIPRTCTVEAVSDDGSIDETVIVYNTAKGYSIDYTTGNVTKDAA